MGFFEWLFGDDATDGAKIEEPTRGYESSNWWASDHPSQTGQGDQSAERWFG